MGRADAYVRASAAVIAFCVAVVAFGSSDARAQQSANQGEQARAAFERALALVGEERWDAAVLELQRSLELQPTQVALYNLALCFEQLHRTREAIEQLERFVREYGAQASSDRRQQVDQALQRLRGLPGRVRVTVDVPGAVVQVDGQLVSTSRLAQPIELPPGSHLIEAQADGHEAARQRVEIVPDETVVTSLTLPPVSAPPAPRAESPPPAPERPPVRIERPSPAGSRPTGLRPAWFWAAAGLGAAATLGTAVLGTLVVTGDAAYERDEDRTRADQKTGKLMMTLTDVALATAFVAAVGAVILYTQTDFGGAEDRSDADRATASRAPSLAVGPGGIRWAF